VIQDRRSKIRILKVQSDTGKMEKWMEVMGMEELERLEMKTVGVEQALAPLLRHIR
jgi:hypothetical protein